jgi:D-serine deaminase-like pyridoxal phosphate-dependent protein
MIQRPGLLVDQQIVRRNIEVMVKKFKNQGINFKPHFKTHQSGKIGEFFREKGINGITVSSVEMGQYFANNGWKDITIAFPANPLEKQELLNLADKVDLHLVTAEEKTLDTLNFVGDTPIKWWIKIDVGSGRAGLKFDQQKEILDIATKVLLIPGFSLEGLLGHAGQTYHSNGKEEVSNKERRAIAGMKAVKSFLESELNKKIKVSLGDTPGCSLLDNWKGVDEVRPGNFVFYDLMQLDIGSCNFKDIALAMACPVVETDPIKKKAIVHGGAIHFSKEFNKTYKYGQVLISKNNQSWSGPLDSCFLEEISQEHGVISFQDGQEGYFSVGNVVFIMPVHSCLTVDSMREYYLLPEMDRVKTYRGI